MKSEFKNQLITGIKTSPIIYIPHFHCSFVDEVITEVLGIHSGNTSIVGLDKNSILEFDISQGIIDFFTKEQEIDLDIYSNLMTYLRDIVDYNSHFNTEKIFLFKNFAEVLQDNRVISLLKLFASKYENGFYDDLVTIIIVSPESISDLPSSIQKFMTVIDILPPNVDEIKTYLIECIGDNCLSNSRTKKDVDEMVRTLQGLQMYEVKQTLKTVLSLTNHRLSRRAISLALEEKKRIVKKSGIIEIIDTDVKFEDVGGLQRLQEDLKVKSRIFSNLGDAVKYNIPIPKGILIIGMPGCGKSMIAQATANKFGVSLLRLDVSRLMGKYVGESEANLRMALATAEAAHPCVLWIDEIEKAFAGSNNSNGDNDMLVMRMMGHFLTWMQERKTPVYIVATANDVMRPEFMRKGRFDEVYYVNFPEEAERAEILRKKIAKRYSTQKDSLFDFSDVGDCTSVVKSMYGEYGGFSGSEIECVLNMVVEDKFSQYLVSKEESRDEEFKPSTIKITKRDFEVAVEKIKGSVMSNQKGKKINQDELTREKTSIERIRDMQSIYNFVNAKG